MTANITNTDPARTYFAATELNQKEIDETFRSLPWCDVLVLVDKTSMTRKEWKQDVAARAEAAAAEKGIK